MKIMKFSEALDRGIPLIPANDTGNYVDYEYQELEDGGFKYLPICACAVGTAAIGAVGVESFEPFSAGRTSRTQGWDRIVVEHPITFDKGKIDDIASDLYEEFGWTREQIRDWARSIGE